VGGVVAANTIDGSNRLIIRKNRLHESLNVNQGVVLEYSNKKKPHCMATGLFKINEMIVLDHIDIHELTGVASAAEAYGTVSCCKKGVVRTDTDVTTWVELSSTLANDDITGDYRLAAEFFNTQASACGVTAVPGGTTAFFMCHGSFLFVLKCEFVDAQAGQMLAMAVAFLISFATLFLKDDNFIAFEVLKYGCFHTCTGYGRRSY